MKTLNNKNVLKSKVSTYKIKKRMICMLLVTLCGFFGAANADDMCQTPQNSSYVVVDPAHLKFIELVETRLVQGLPDFIQPTNINIPVIQFEKISSPFGMRKDPVTGRTTIHTGVDLPFHAGTPIFAPANGIVTFSGWENGFGNVVKIDYGNGYETLFAHNSKNFVHRGQRVQRSTEIGIVGKTGWATGPHIHVEIRHNGELINPTSFLHQSK